MAMYSRTVLFLVLATITFGLWLKYAGEMTVPEQPLRSTGWKKIAGQKLEDNHAKIPQEWLLPPELVSSARERDRVAGDFIESLLDPDTVKITSTDAPQLVQEMSDGVWTAYQVVSAFCKRAAYAHQLVCIASEFFVQPGANSQLIFASGCRAPCCLKSTSPLHSIGPERWMHISREAENWWGRSTACPLRLKISFTSKVLKHPWHTSVGSALSRAKKAPEKREMLRVSLSRNFCT